MWPLLTHWILAIHIMIVIITIILVIILGLCLKGHNPAFTNLNRKRRCLLKEYMKTQDQELWRETLELESWQDSRQPPSVFHFFCLSETIGSSFHAFALFLSDCRLIFFGATCIR